MREMVFADLRDSEAVKVRRDEGGLRFGRDREQPRNPIDRPIKHRGKNRIVGFFSNAAALHFKAAKYLRKHIHEDEH